MLLGIVSRNGGRNERHAHSVIADRGEPRLLLHDARRTGDAGANHARVGRHVVAMERDVVRLRRPAAETATRARRENAVLVRRAFAWPVGLLSARLRNRPGVSARHDDRRGDEERCETSMHGRQNARSRPCASCAPPCGTKLAEEQGTVLDVRRPLTDPWLDGGRMRRRHDPYWSHRALSRPRSLGAGS